MAALYNLGMPNGIVADTLTDKIPAGMKFLRASPEPNEHGGVLMEWTIPELMPGEVETVEHDARTTADGSYVNSVHVEAASVDGNGFASKDAAARIDISSTGVALKTTRYGGWQAPDWNMTSPDEGITIELSPDRNLIEQAKS